MSKTSTPAVPQATPQNPEVLIRYSPDQTLEVLGKSAKHALEEMQNAPAIKNVTTLDRVSELISSGSNMADQIEDFRKQLCERVAAAAANFRKFPGFEDFEVTVTIRKWRLRDMLVMALTNLRSNRARFQAAEQDRIRQEQIKAEAEQRRKNEEAAKKAAAQAKKAGADPETVDSIRQEVLTTPAPLVQSTTLEHTRAAGVSVRYSYTAKITNLKEFLSFCLSNPVMWNTLKEGAEADIAAAFNKMAAAQKEAFRYPGITFDKKPIDVSRGR